MKPSCPHWCAQGHQCALGEHRSRPVTLARAGQRISVVVTLVRRAGRSHAEVRLSIRFTSTTDTGQARELWHVLRRLSALTREDVPR